MNANERKAWDGRPSSAPLTTTNPVGRQLASGVINAPKQQYATLTEFAALSWSAPHGQAQEVSLMTYWPPVTASFEGWPPAQLVNRTVCNFVEYGAGASSTKIYMDARPSQIALGPCTYVRAGLAVGPGYDGAPYTPPGDYEVGCPMSLVEGATAGEPPTFTIFGMVDGTYTFPRRAYDVELLAPGTIATPNRLISQLYDASPAVMIPPWAPVRLPGAAGGVETFTWTNTTVTPGSLGICVFGLGL